MLDEIKLLVHAYHIISFLVRQKKAKKESEIFGLYNVNLYFCTRIRERTALAST